MSAQIGDEARAADDSCLGDKLLAIESWGALAVRRFALASMRLRSDETCA
jgi:hypothetical protein